MASVDGKILVDRWSNPSGEASKGELMGIYSEIGRSLQTDAWTFGKNTVTEIFPDKFGGTAENSVQHEESVFKGKLLSPRMFISIDPDANIRYTSSSLRGDDILVVVGKNASTEYLAFLREKNISYIVVDDIADFHAIFEAINKRFGIASVSLQGGGILNAAMLNQGVIDELSLVLYPGIDGTCDSRSIFDYFESTASKEKTQGGKSPVNGQSLQLLDIERKKNGVVWLRYKVLPNNYRD